MQLEKQVYSVKEAAQVLGISAVKLYQLCKTEDFPCVRLGARIIIPIDRLHRWLNQDNAS